MINLLPLDEKRSLTKLYRLRFFSMLFVLFSVAVLAGYILLIPSYFLTVTKENLIAQERELLESTQEYIEFDALRDTARIVNERIEVMDRDGEIAVYDDLITRLLLRKTNDVTIANVAYAQRGTEGRTIELRGQARDRAALVEFIQVLESDEALDVVDAPVSNYVTPDDLSYTLQLQLVLPDDMQEEDGA